MDATNLPKGANGVLRLNLGLWGLWHEVEVVGGPYRNRTRDHYGVCLLEQEPADYQVWLPIPDFSIPDSETDTEYALTEVLYQLLCGRRVWVGCAGGFGRTGLVLALLAKVAGYEDAVGYVRKTYHSSAVETPQQARYVADFPVKGIRRWLLKKSFERKWRQVYRWLNWRTAKSS